MPDGGQPDWRQMETLALTVRARLNHMANAGALRRDAEAADAWRKLYAALAAEDDDGMAGALLARAEAHVAKLSLIYAALDGSPEIRLEHLLAAAAFWEYASNSVRHLFQGLPADPEAARALEFIRGAGAEGASVTDLHSLFHRNLPGERIRAILRALVADGLVREIKTDGLVRGPKKQRFVAVTTPEGGADAESPK